MPDWLYWSIAAVLLLNGIGFLALALGLWLWPRRTK